MNSKSTTDTGTPLSDQLRQLVRSQLQCRPMAEVSYVVFGGISRKESVERFLSGSGMTLKTAEKFLATWGVTVSLSPTTGNSNWTDDPARSLSERLRGHLLRLIEQGSSIQTVSRIVYRTGPQPGSINKLLYQGGGMTLATAENIIRSLNLVATISTPATPDALSQPSFRWGNNRFELEIPEQLPAVLWREDGSGIPPSKATPADSTGTTPDAQQQ